MADMIGWEWKGGWTVNGSWKKDAKSWSALLIVNGETFQCLNRSWEVADEDAQWMERWKQLRDFETVEHLLWSCYKLRERVYWVSEVILGPGVGNPTLLQVIDKCLLEHKRNPTFFILQYEHCRTCWLERNEAVFNNPSQFKSAQNIINTVKETCTGIGKRLSEEKKLSLYRSRDLVVENALRTLRDHQRRQEDGQRLLLDFRVALSDNNSQAGVSRSSGKEILVPQL
ncbi:hypothetical protein R1sor_016989 [Riccia sorocarpa]|uniref:Uncharacterized protein n=1 Tax=Riccia sorocarpa TaxID=122646 RepID=A0ABD3I9I6_9MARC